MRTALKTIHCLWTWMEPTTSWVTQPRDPATMVVWTTTSCWQSSLLPLTELRPGGRQSLISMGTIDMTMTMTDQITSERHTMKKVISVPPVLPPSLLRVHGRQRVGTTGIKISPITCSFPFLFSTTNIHPFMSIPTGISSLLRIRQMTQTLMTSFCKGE